MKKLFKSALFLAILSGIGYVIYLTSEKMKKLKGEYENTIFCNGKSMKFDGQEISETSYAVMFAGLEMDFRGATLAADTVTIKLYSEFAGVSIQVPEDWQVKLTGTSERSGVGNSARYSEDSDQPVLVIEQNIKYSGLEIKY